jgi:hypothetical protein
MKRAGENSNDDTEAREHAKTVNASGFLYQLRIEHVLRGLRNQGVAVVAREHAWSDGGAEAGFADLVAKVGRLRFVIECKRPRGAKWYFLADQDPDPEAPLVRALWTCLYLDHRHRQQPDLAPIPKSGVEDWVGGPPGIWESAFCVVRGQEAERPLLERTAWSLLAATEAIAAESLHQARIEDDEAIWIPVIVTAAELYVCRVEPGEINLESGELPTVKAKPVDWLLFRKPLRLELTADFDPKVTRLDASGVDKASADRERSVIVVRGTSLEQLFVGRRRFTIAGPAFGRNMPWSR